RDRAADVEVVPWVDVDREGVAHAHVKALAGGGAVQAVDLDDGSAEELRGPVRLNDRSERREDRAPAFAVGGVEPAGRGGRTRDLLRLVEIRVSRRMGGAAAHGEH